MSAEDSLSPRQGRFCCYFSYGSNMGTRWLRFKGVRPAASMPARLPDFHLGFASAFWVPGLFRGMATVQPRPGAQVHGVLHRITPFELFVLDFSERTYLGLYRRLTVTVACADGRQVSAYLHVARRTAAPRRPDRRYLDKVMNGAREFGLPQAWLARLEEGAGSSAASS